VVCARGVCVLADEDIAEELCYLDEDEEGNLVGMTCVTNTNQAKEELDIFSFEFLWPRALLLGCSVLYGTNFPLGRIMNEALPASATTSGRMILASLALFPFLLKLAPELRKTAVVGGSFCALGYLAQSVALVDTPAATVAFLGALVVIITPATSFFFANAKLGWKDAPQTWLAAALSLTGVGCLELLGDDGGLTSIGMGDFWSVMQAVGFGVGFFFTERMMAKQPEQALSITACQVGMTAFWSGIWAFLDGMGYLGDFAGNQDAWLLDETMRAHYALPGLFLSGFGGDETLRIVAIAAVWTGLITTAANRVAETTGLGKMSSAEASVLLATEPLWAAVFASLFVGEVMGPQDIIGGALIVAACLATALKPKMLLGFFGIEEAGEEEEGGAVSNQALQSAVVMSADDDDNNDANNGVVASANASEESVM
jgi:drug/metabolite transporter (DMT)-like permease